MFGINSRKQKSEAYHKHVIALLNASSKPAAGNGQTQEENAQQAQAVFVHEVNRHTNKRGRVVR